jgi:O-antigen/teichoic acid export membrane protein
LNTRQLLSSAALYGMADVAVMAVSGFLLLPLYTRTLSQKEFGMFVAVRANVDILTYLLHFGLPSAVARLYLDHRKLGTQAAYLSSIVTFFALVLAGFCALLLAWGDRAWALLSPTTPPDPYLAFSVAIAAIGFLSAIANTWLRMEQRAVTLVTLQLTTAAVLAAVAAVNLAVLDLGLVGLMWATVASSTFSALALPWLFSGRFRPQVRREHVVESLRYAVPILVGYVAYFVLNRLSLLILQRHVPVEEVGVYGLAQQLSMIVAIAGTSFGMALQPAVFGAADPAQAMAALRRAGRVLVLLMLATCGVLLMFARELHAVVAPASYADGVPVLLILLIANFTNAFTLISDTALLYHRRPKTSVAVSVAGAVAATVLALWLVPRWHVTGAALAVLGALALRMMVSHWLVHRLTGYAAVTTMAASIAAVASLGLLAHALDGLGLGMAASVALKAALAASLAGAGALFLRKTRTER